MRRIPALSFILIGLWTCFSVMGILVKDSDHLGSGVVNAEQRGNWEQRLNASSLSTEEKAKWLHDLRTLREQGMLGFALRLKSLGYSACCGVALTAAGVILYRSGKPHSQRSPHSEP